MNKEMELEIIKASAYGMDKEEIANFAETTLEEIENFEVAHAKEIETYGQVQEGVN